MGISESCVAADLCGPCSQGRQLEALALRVATGHDVRLMCWCTPRECRADAIAASVRACAPAFVLPKQRRR